MICVGACYCEIAGARDFALELVEAIRKTLNALFEHDARNVCSQQSLQIAGTPKTLAAPNDRLHPCLPPQSHCWPVHRQQAHIRVGRGISGNSHKCRVSVTFAFMMAKVDGDLQLCRRAELLDSVSSSKHVTEIDDVEIRWKQWVSFESKKRLGIAICLLDTMFPAFLDIPAYHSNRDIMHLASPCEDHFWAADTAYNWSNMLGLSSMPPTPLFRAW